MVISDVTFQKKIIKYFFGLIVSFVFIGILYIYFVFGVKNESESAITPVAQPAVTQTVSHIPTPEISANIDPVKSTFSYVDNLYQFGRQSSSYCVSVRTPEANSTEPYPAVYYSTRGTNPIEIREVNLITGQIETLTNLQNSIMTLGCSTGNQRLAYMQEGQVEGQRVVIISIYNLSDSVESNIFTGEYNNTPRALHWSPDGTVLSFFIANTDELTRSEKTGWLYLFDISKSELRKIDWPVQIQIGDVILSNLNSNLMFWGDDSRTVFGEVTVSSSMYVSQTTAYSLDTTTGVFSFVDDGRLSMPRRRFDSPQSVAGKIYSQTRSPYDATSVGEYYGGPGGWLSSFDPLTRTNIDYFDFTGQELDSYFLLSGQGDKLIYRDMKEKRWNFFDLSEMSNGGLSAIGSYDQVVGWGGNYETVVFESSRTLKIFDLQKNEVIKLIAIP